MIEQSAKGHEFLARKTYRFAAKNLQIASLLVKIDGVQESIGLGDPNRLLHLLRPMVQSLDSLNNKLALRVHFHVSPGRSLLRV